MPRKHYYKYLTFLVLSQVTLSAVTDRITRAVDVSRTAPTRGNVSRLAVPEFDQGPVDSTMQMNYVQLVIQPSPAQRADLAQLLADQQNPSSPLYHQC